MLQNYFKTALRNILRHKGYALINVSGLAIGIAACLLLFLVIKYELSYDTFQPNYENIYHIYTSDTYSDGTDKTPGIPFPALEALRADLPQVQFAGICSSYQNQITLHEGTVPKKFVEETGVFFTEPEFFKVFTYKWLAGNETVLSQPNTVVLCKSLATKYFNTWETALGKVLKLDNNLDLKVAGIIEDSPFNSDFRLKLIGSFITIKKAKIYHYNDEWGSTTSNFQIYMLFPKNVPVASVEKQLPQLAKKYYKNDLNSIRLNHLRPLKKIHYDTELGSFGTHFISSSTLLSLTLIGTLIIIMACINFINLSTAQAVGRSKEVGIRKVLGSNRKQLFWQFLGETKLVVLFSSTLAIILASLALPYLKHVVSIEEDLHLFDTQSVLFLLCTIVLVTLFAGVYPSLILSGFKPVMALKNKINSTTIGGISLRRSLVVLQFAISQVLIICTIIAISQMNFVRTADLGFNKEAILLIQGSSDTAVVNRYAAFGENLLQMPEVNSVSFASDVPSSENNSGTNFAFNRKPDEQFTLFLKFGDADYFKTFGLNFVAGTGYPKSDTITDVVINETLLKKLNISSPEQAIGKELKTGGSRWRRICGVVKDFKTNSLREEVKPIMIASRKSRYEVSCIKLKTKNLIKTQSQIQKIWEKFFPDYVYTSSFMDQTIENFYKQETQMALLYKIFAGLAIFISCLGLYGLVSFMVVQKTKEVGIRKVLGAGIKSIIYLFSKEFTVLVIISMIIAVPVAYYFMNEWLNNFAYRINIGFWVFGIAALVSVFVAWLTVGYKAVSAALVNPVKSLRSE